jgi:hypothetical protein
MDQWETLSSAFPRQWSEVGQSLGILDFLSLSRSRWRLELPYISISWCTCIIALSEQECPCLPSLDNTEPILQQESTKWPAKWLNSLSKDYFWLCICKYHSLVLITYADRRYNRISRLKYSGNTYTIGVLVFSVKEICWEKSTFSAKAVLELCFFLAKTLLKNNPMHSMRLQ